MVGKTDIALIPWNLHDIGFSHEIYRGIHWLGSEENDIIKQHPEKNKTRTIPKPFIFTNPAASNNKQPGSSAFRLG